MMSEVTDADDEYGRGILKIINNKIHLELSDDYEHPQLSSVIIKDSYDGSDKPIEYIIENVLADNDISRLLDNKSLELLHDLYNSCYSVYCLCRKSNDCNNGTINQSKSSTAISYIPNEVSDNLLKEDDGLGSLCMHGGNYIVHQDKFSLNNKELILNRNRLSKDLLYECTELCQCMSTCTNRLVQYGPRKHLQIIDLSHLNKQLGVWTTKPIPMGGFICEYAGELITKAEAKRRHLHNYIHKRMNYIICLNEYRLKSHHQQIPEHQTHEQHQTDTTLQEGIYENVHSLTSQLCDRQYSDVEQKHSSNNGNGQSFNETISYDTKLDSNDYVGVEYPQQIFIDPSEKGNIGRYINHSCDPNCEILSVRISCPLPKLGIFAKRDIPAFEELCFDYGENCKLQEETLGLSNCLSTIENVPIFDDKSVEERKLCYCGSDNCRKYLPNIKY